MTTRYAQVLVRYDFSDDLYYFLGEQYLSLMISRGDTNMCDHINTPWYNLWHVEQRGVRENSETCLSPCVPFLGTHT